MRDTNSKRRPAGPFVLGLLAVIGTLLAGILISSCWPKAVQPSTPAASGSPDVVLPSISTPPTQAVSPGQGQSAPAGSPTPTAPGGATGAPMLPTLPPGPGEPGPSVQIPPPIY